MKHVVFLRLKRILTLAVPAIIGELSSHAMGLVDTMMVGGLGPRSLAAVGLGNSFFFPILLLFTGVLIALDTLIATSVGQKDYERAGKLLTQGLWLSFGMGIPLAIAFQFTEPVLLWLGQEAPVAKLAAAYLGALGFSIPPFLAYTCYRAFGYGFGDTRMAMYVTLAAIFVNAAGNWLLLTGNLGFPALGVAGLGYATAFCRVFMLFALAAITHGSEKFSQSVPRLRWPAQLEISEIVFLGAPIGGLFLFETGGFAAAGMMAGWLGEIPLAANQVALTLAGTAIMIPIGISLSAAILIGQELGEDNPDEATLLGAYCLGLTILAMVCTAGLFWFFPRALGAAFTTHEGTLQVVATVMPIAAIFQIWDGLQCVAAGCLRGAGDTRSGMICSLLAYWVFGLPLGYWLAFHKDWALAGIWTGLAVALFLIGLVLTTLFLTRRWEKPSSHTPHS